MKIEVTYRRFPEEISPLLPGAEPAELAALCDATSLFFSVEDVAAIVGVIYPSMLSGSPYLWLAADWESITRADLLRAKRAGKKFLSSFHGELLAEVASDDPAARKFAEAFGFRFLTDLGDRHLMQWSA